MPRIFVDASYYIALLNSADSFHNLALRVGRDVDARKDASLITTESVLDELLSFASGRGPGMRNAAVQLVDRAQANPSVTVLGQTSDIFRRGVELYRRRPDKTYSLTDCMSMVVCTDQGIREVLTTDHDFEQEGFTILLKR